MSDLNIPFTSELLATELLDAIAVPAWLHRGSIVLHANDAMQRLCGRDLASLRALDFLTLVDPNERDGLAQASDVCLQGDGQPPARSAKLLTPDGSVRHVEISLRRVNLNGEATALVTCVDQSDVYHVQGSLQAMSELLRQIVDGAPVASFVIDRYHSVTHWNSACEHMTGCSAEQMIGTTEAWRAFYPEQRPLLADLIVDGIDEKTMLDLYGGSAKPTAHSAGAYEVEGFLPHVGPKGSWLYFTAAPLRDKDDLIIGAIETLQDVSQRKGAEAELLRHRNDLEQLVEARSAELAASARELEAFLDNAPIGVLYTAAGKVLRSNRKLVEMFGLKQESAVGMPAADFYLSADDYGEVGRIAQPLLAQGKPLHHEMWLRHAAGSRIWVQMNAYASDHQDTGAGAWWMLQDRTEVRNAEEAVRSRFEELQQTNRKLEDAQNQLLQSEKMASIGQLAAGVAHEINNPVGFVSSNLNTLRQYVGDLLTLVDAYAAASATPGDASATTHLASTCAAVELDYLKEDLPQLLNESADGLARVKKIVQDLKDFSRVDHADWHEADLNSGLESTLNVVRHEVKYRAEVVKQLSPLPGVLCVAAQLNQVFMNLIVNAAHAIAERGVITLSSGTVGDWAWVQVDDTGCGMTEEVQRRIFEPFYTTKEVGKGTGLGLSLSFSIVKKHAGAIQVRSAVGQGSSFRVWIPINGPDAAPGLQLPDWA